MQFLAIKTGPKVATEEPDGLTAKYWSNWKTYIIFVVVCFSLSS